MIFKAYLGQALPAGTSFLQDLKLGRYIKVPRSLPPRATFKFTVATVLAALGVKQWIFTHVADMSPP